MPTENLLPVSGVVLLPPMFNWVPPCYILIYKCMYFFLFARIYKSVASLGFGFKSIPLWKILYLNGQANWGIVQARRNGEAERERGGAVAESPRENIKFGAVDFLYISRSVIWCMRVSWNLTKWFVYNKWLKRPLSDIITSSSNIYACTRMPINTIWYVCKVDILLFVCCPLVEPLHPPSVSNQRPPSANSSHSLHHSPFTSIWKITGYVCHQVLIRNEVNGWSA